MLTSEISTIYKQDGKVRKVHHLLGAPSLEAVRRINTRLAAIGNIVSDGRPILGLSSRDLLEIVLEADENAFIIPAHIWTPWFSALGSKSGFDCLEDCYLDLSPHIFAFETGLSSDPLMNWRVSRLDGYNMISCSDAHSTANLGREATCFDCALDYFALLTALKTGAGLRGTLEFFPEEGKYHLDGHCGVAYEPAETARLNGRCPICGREITVGVLSRVCELADRPEGLRPAGAKDFASLIPLAEILGEIMQVGCTSRRVKAAYDGLIANLGGELKILLETDLADIRTAGGEVLALALERMRTGQVIRKGGFDGQFGEIRVFGSDENDLLFQAVMERRQTGIAPASAKRSAQKKTSDSLKLNAGQLAAVSLSAGNFSVAAGPGTGKTRVLVERIKQLPGSILAITFTNKAAEEIRARLGADSSAEVFTFHALAAHLLRAGGRGVAVADEAELRALAEAQGLSAELVDQLLFKLSTCQSLTEPEAAFLKGLTKLPFEGLIREALELALPRWEHVLVDEFQDINPLQYEFLRRLSRDARSVMVIGDRHQAIYGFRGSSVGAFEDFGRDFAPVEHLSLRETYRLTEAVASCANAFVQAETVVSGRGGEPVRIVGASFPADFIAQEIEALAGGLSSSKLKRAKAEYALSEIAVIVRTKNQAKTVMEALAKHSIPFDAAYATPLAERRGVRERLALLEGREIASQVRGLGEAALSRLDSGLKPEQTSRLQAALALSASLSGSVSERLNRLELSGLFKLPALDEEHVFYRYAELFGCDLEGFGQFLRLSQDQGALNGEHVRILTAHAAKGLEFKCVFLSGSYPLPGMDLAEERNLFYVALTRAIDRLYVVEPLNERGPFGRELPRPWAEYSQAEVLRRSQQELLF
ncbi:MAG: ATP-dependent DNA helicase UvrD1 [Deltaproteobacteria bacterium ADurb.Bin510]|nr:MAG: ATP-dependent DNA helicase UvrD1 [Deltaproteobacteria bacterium ADurb.Bin510]